MKWYVTGDVHRNYNSRFKYYTWQYDSNVALIVLGDLGFNYLLDERDKDWKRSFCNKYDFQLYAVRGNHEERPQNIGAQLVYDENVKGYIYWEKEYPNIHYFLDYGEYNINGYKVLVIGGAYSVDKYWRIQTRKKENGWCGWFVSEQLNDVERAEAAILVKNKSYDFVLTHTCPVSWEPRDLFLSMVDQSTVDKTMELWFEEIKSSFFWKVWLFGHYHADRFERPHVEQFFEKTDELENIYNRWEEYDITGNLPWYIKKSPLFYNKEDCPYKPIE